MRTICISILFKIYPFSFCFCYMMRYFPTVKTNPFSILQPSTLSRHSAPPQSLPSQRLSPSLSADSSPSVFAGAASSHSRISQPCLSALPSLPEFLLLFQSTQLLSANITYTLSSSGKVPFPLSSLPTLTHSYLFFRSQIKGHALKETLRLG